MRRKWTGLAEAGLFGCGSRFWSRSGANVAFKHDQIRPAHPESPRRAQKVAHRRRRTGWARFPGHPPRIGHRPKQGAAPPTPPATPG